MLSLFLYRFTFTLLFLFHCRFRFRFRFRFLFPFQFLFRIPVSGFSRRPSLKRLDLKFGLSFQNFSTTYLYILLDVLFRVLRFSKASFYALASSFMTF